jgi:hypothetical protein
MIAQRTPGLALEKKLDKKRPKLRKNWPVKKNKKKYRKKFASGAITPLVINVQMSE